MQDTKTDLSEREIAALSAMLDQLPAAEQAKVMEMLGQFEATRTKEKARSHFLDFVKFTWPGFVEGNHHKIIARAFDRIASGDLKRLIICMPPRHTKSEFGSIHFPAYFLGKHPDKKLIMASNTAELAVGFGRKVRNLINGDLYGELFDTRISGDNKAAGRWGTSGGGEYFAIGVGGTMTGRGADCMIIDDPHSEAQGALGILHPEIFDGTYEWYSSGPRQRLQPGAAIVLIATRWHSNDLIGRVIESSIKAPKSQQWEVIELPAILPSGRPLWPAFWPLAELEALRDELPGFKWNAQYQQKPGGSDVAILKRDWWQKWTDPDPPECDFVLSAFDTAFTKEKRSNHSACAVFGVFTKPGADKWGNEGDVPNLILLDCWKERLDFPELKAKLIEHYHTRRPDVFLIENRATGGPLIQEFREIGLVVSEFTPARGMSKIVRANAVSDILASGRVWAPDTGWAEDMIGQCELFPFGAEDDLVDALTMALLRFRQGGFIGTKNDHSLEDEEERWADRRKRKRYY